MNAWDYLAGQLMIKAAGGIVKNLDVGKVLKSGGRVISASPAIC